MSRVRGAQMRAVRELHRTTLQEHWLTYVVIVLLAAMILATALAVVVSRHEARVLFHELEALKRVAEDSAVEWDRLQIEESYLSTHHEIEQKARTRLSMDMPIAASSAVTPPAPGSAARLPLEYVKP